MQNLPEVQIEAVHVFTFISCGCFYSFYLYTPEFPFPWIGLEVVVFGLGWLCPSPRVAKGEPCMAEQGQGPPSPSEEPWWLQSRELWVCDVQEMPPIKQEEEQAPPKAGQSTVRNLKLQRGDWGEKSKDEETSSPRERRCLHCSDIYGKGKLYLKPRQE